MTEARYYSTDHNQVVRCELCPHQCTIQEGNRGTCKVRKNRGGQLWSENYGRISAVHFDPIEKKPLYHFHPGSVILSIGSIGCNMSCKFCQNCEISQASIDDLPLLARHDADDIVAMALARPGNKGIAYTYNEPVVWYEFMADVAARAREAGLSNVMVTNGFISHKPLADLIPLIDAFSVDLKAFNEEFYRRLTFSRLEPVKESLIQIAASGKHLEITNLVIPDHNDDPSEFEEMVGWIAEALGKDTILHISRYFPMHKMSKPPTPVSTIRKLHAIATRHLDHAYIGNVHQADEGNDTICPSCGKLLIRRQGYHTEVTGLDHEGRCIACSRKIVTC